MNLPSDLFARVRFVLVGTSHPGNVGSAARAIKTMGFTRLALAARRCEPGEVARSLASGADDVLAARAEHASLAEALTDCVFCVAATARPREISAPVHDARSAALALAAAAAHGPVALVFGNETSGLANEEVRLCNAVAHIPANPAYSSLNLAAAVQVFAYEMRMALDCAIPQPAGDHDAPATRAEVEGLISQAERVLAAIGFFDPANPKRLLPRLRRLAARSRLEREEINILRGMLAHAAKAAQPGAEAGAAKPAPQD
ncbi:MAG: RNA methyltransferase [Burkholderiales bacterium]|nr:RNA methyltransferase [Burkholderiales bacterium]